MRVSCTLICLVALPLCSQDQPPPAVKDQERGMWSREFGEGRTPAAQAKRSAPAPALMLGLTAWLLRQDGRRGLFHDSAEPPTVSYTPERIGADTMLANDDRIRITVEPGRAGHLYIASREAYANGEFGDAFLVFPSQKIRGGSAAVAPSEVVDVPEWNNPTPYFRVHRGRPDQTGEQLVMLLVQRPIAGLIVPNGPAKLPPETLAGWVRRWGADVRMLDAPAGKGAPLSEPEQRAASAGVPLRPGDPLPQILFRSNARAQDGLLATFTLRLRP